MFILGISIPFLIGGRVLNILDPDSEFLLYRCRVDRAFHMPILGAYYAWSLSSVGFRYIMIKYAERGLVEQGYLKSLIEYLFYVANIFYWCIGLAIDFGKYIKMGARAEEEMKFLKICSKTVKGGNHILLVNIFLVVLVLMIPVTILTVGVNHYIKKNTCKGSKKFGTYQRNMVTFHQTAVAFVCSIFCLLLQPLLVDIMGALSVPQDTVRTFQLCYWILENGTWQFVLPSIIIVKLNRLGEFYF